jgi:hypothetical protein
MKVKFIGNQLNPEDNRGFFIRHGERFELNVPRELPEGPLFAKIPKNGHFQVVPEEPEPAADEPTVSGMTKDELIAIAEEQGVKVDKRWNVEKIAAAIDGAKQESE